MFWRLLLILILFCLCISLLIYLVESFDPAVQAVRQTRAELAAQQARELAAFMTQLKQIVLIAIALGIIVLAIGGPAICVWWLYQRARTTAHAVYPNRVGLYPAFITRTGDYHGIPPNDPRAQIAVALAGAGHLSSDARRRLNDVIVSSPTQNDDEPSKLLISSANQISPMHVLVHDEDKT